MQLFTLAVLFARFLQVWPALAAKDLLSLGRAASAHWQSALALVETRLPCPSPFALLTMEERARALHFLQTLERAWLFENFANMDPETFAATAEGVPALFCKQGALWRVGPGAEAPPQIQRVPCSDRLRASKSSYAPLGHWCICLSNEDPLTSLGPSGLVFSLPLACRPSLVVYRCKAAALSPYRAGAVLALAHGLGNDKGPERPLIFMTFVRDGKGREIFASNSSREPLANWSENTWMTIGISLDWQSQELEICLEDAAQPGVRLRVPFADKGCDAVSFLLLYNQTGAVLSMPSFVDGF